MVAIKALTVLALAGASIAAPVANPAPLQVGEALERREAYNGRPSFRWSWRWGGQGSRQGEAQPQSTPTAAAPAAPSSTPETASAPPSTTDAASSDSDNFTKGAPQSGSSGSGTGSAAPATPSTGTTAGSTGGSSGGSGSGYMAIVNEWRSKMGLSNLQEDSKLQANAADAATSANGQLVHKLNPGSMGQVMAPGNDGNFESVFVGGWLCEMPSLPGLGASVCNSASQGWDHAGQTGHAKILTSPDYSKIGCAVETGIWSCDLA